MAPRSYGARRSHGTRKHGGRDLYAPAGSPILAFESRTVLDITPFHDGTWYVSVEHDDYMVRYGELSPKVPKDFGSARKCAAAKSYRKWACWPSKKMSMLHFEMYSNTVSGPRSNTVAPYRRRADLIDPTPHLDKALVMAGTFDVDVLRHSSIAQSRAPWSAVGAR